MSAYAGFFGVFRSETAPLSTASSQTGNAIDRPFKGPDSGRPPVCLSDEFQQFHDLLDELIASYHGFGRRNEFVSETIGVPDYTKCKNCTNLGESTDDNPICLDTGVEEDGETLYKIIPDTESIPSFCSRDMRYFDFPENRLEEVNDDLLAIAE